MIEVTSLLYYKLKTHNFRSKDDGQENMIDYIDRVMSIPSYRTPDKSKVNMIKKWMSSADKSKSNKAKAKKAGNHQAKAKKANKDKLPAMTKSKSSLTDVPQNVQVSIMKLT